MIYVLDREGHKLVVLAKVKQAAAQPLEDHADVVAKVEPLDQPDAEPGFFFVLFFFFFGGGGCQNLRGIYASSASEVGVEIKASSGGNISSVELLGAESNDFMILGQVNLKAETGSIVGPVVFSRLKTITESVNTVNVATFQV